MRVKFNLYAPLRDRLLSRDFIPSERRDFLLHLVARVVERAAHANGSLYPCRASNRVVLESDTLDDAMRGSLLAFDHIERETRIALTNVVAEELMREHEIRGGWPRRPHGRAGRFHPVREPYRQRLGGVDLRRPRGPRLRAVERGGVVDERIGPRREREARLPYRVPREVHLGHPPGAPRRFPVVPRGPRGAAPHPPPRGPRLVRGPQDGRVALRGGGPGPTGRDPHPEGVRDRALLRFPWIPRPLQTGHPRGGERADRRGHGAPGDDGRVASRDAGRLP